MVARFRALWSAAGAATVVCAVMACTLEVRGNDWMAPPGWDQWLFPTDWQSAVIRGQTVEPQQTTRAESLGFLASLDFCFGLSD